MDDFSAGKILKLTAEIVSAYVSHNSLPVAELPGLMQKINDALGQIRSGEAVIMEIQAPLTPAVAIKKSVTDDYIISLEDGRKFKSLKRHLRVQYGMTTDKYRTKWGLPPTYPMVAPGYAKKRSELARGIGLGRKAAKPAPEPVEAAPVPKTAAKKKTLEPAVTETATTPATKPRKAKIGSRSPNMAASPDFIPSEETRFMFAPCHRTVLPAK